MARTCADSPATPALTDWVNRHVWLDGCDLQTEFTQAQQEGRDLGPLEAEFQRLLAVPKPDGWGKVLGAGRDLPWLAAAAALLDRVQERPIRTDYPYCEPDALCCIQQCRPAAAPLPKWKGGKKDFLRRLHGGWLGRICGCMLGKPVEGWRRRSIRASAKAMGNWPLADYWRLPTRPEAKKIAAAKVPNTLSPDRKALLQDGMDGMVEDDDTNYTTIGFGVVRQYGASFTPQDVATFWLQNVPILHTCTAERVAYRNFVNLREPPRSATYRNPYREWIGAQIRADYFGYANPGNPERAADWAWRDACISHVRNGIYGEMWVAAMLAAAYVLPAPAEGGDAAAVIRAGLAQIPEKCRLSADVQKVLVAQARGKSYDEVIEQIHTQWNEDAGHDWCHTNSNAQIVAAALLYGGDDYGKTISLAVMPGLDTDCNGATAGSVWGVMHGVDALPRPWTKPMRNRIRTGVEGFHDVRISDLAEEMVEVALRNR